MFLFQTLLNLSKNRFFAQLLDNIYIDYIRILQRKQFFLPDMIFSLKKISYPIKKPVSNFYFKPLRPISYYTFCFLSIIFSLQKQIQIKTFLLLYFSSFHYFFIVPQNNNEIFTFSHFYLFSINTVFPSNANPYL